MTRKGTLGVRRILLAAPRGQCAGVRRAVAAVEEGLARWGPPLYVRRQIVHNAHVVEALEARGAVFVQELDEVPEGSRVVFSAHGVAPAVETDARERGLAVLDATCPLVTKVHSEVRHYADRGYTVILIGHAGHDEVEGTSGVAPDAILLVETEEDAERVTPPTGPLAFVTQTTLGVDDTAAIVDVLRRRFPTIDSPAKEDICYATTNRQRAVAALLDDVDALLVVGSSNSSNSRRLVEVAAARGIRAHMVDDERAIRESWLDGVETLGVTAGASTPEALVERLLEWLAERTDAVVEERGDPLENVTFRAPAAVRGAP
jgi:4-hydroxy-3-methylbut-2-enyl diphosphate reductase